MARELELSAWRATSNCAAFLPSRLTPLPGPALVEFKSQPRAFARNFSAGGSELEADTNPRHLQTGRNDVASTSSSSRREIILLGLQRILAAGSAWNAVLEAFPASAKAAAAAGGTKKAGVAESKPGPKFYHLEGSGGVQVLDIRYGTGSSPLNGDKVAIHYYARLVAKQGWRFDSSYDHKDSSGAPEPYVFVVGDGTADSSYSRLWQVIAGLDTAIRTMKEGGVRRIIIPPSQGYQNMMQGPVPPNYSDRQRLFTTIFNPTRLANGEGSTLGTLVFDVELLGIRPP